jgi:hypothetical protein
MAKDKGQKTMNNGQQTKNNGAMKLHSLYFLLHGDLDQAKKDLREFDGNFGMESEVKLYESFILKNQKAFSQSINARLAPQAATGTGLGAKEVCDILKGFSDNDRIVVSKYVVTLELGEKPKIIEVETSADEKAIYLRELVQRELGMNGDML